MSHPTFPFLLFEALLHVTNKIKHHVSILSFQIISVTSTSLPHDPDSEGTIQHTFGVFCKKYVEDKIIGKGRVMRMTKLQSLLQGMFEEGGAPPAFANTTYLRQKLCRKYPQLQFHRPSRMNVSGIVYCEGYESTIVDHWESDASSSDSESNSSEAPEAPEALDQQELSKPSETDTHRVHYHSAQMLRQVLRQVKGLKDKWPPLASDMDMNAVSNIVPVDLFNYLAWVTEISDEVGGYDKYVSTSDDQRWKLLSVAQDIIYLHSRGRAITPKHSALSMTVRHSTGSSKLIDVLNGLGHCTSHSKVLEHDVALATVQLRRQGIIPNGFVKSSHTILVWDNNDFAEDTPTGHNTTHNTNGVIIQRESEIPCSQPETRRLSKTKQRSLEPPPSNIVPYRGGTRQGPVCIDAEMDGGTVSVEKLEVQIDVAYCLSKTVDSKLPGWTGFNTTLQSSSIPRKSKIGYLPIIDASPTEMATVHTVLLRSVDIANNLDLNAITVVFDQAIYSKAQEIRWQHKIFQERLVLRLGDFHLVMAFLGCMGKRFQDSGFEDVLIESGAIAAGSIKGVQTGHHYNRAMRCHKLLYEALHRLRWQSFLKTLPESECQMVTSTLAELGQSNLEDGWMNILQTNQVQEVLQTYEGFVKQERTRSALYDFWSSYLDMVQILLLSIRATREGNWSLHLDSCKKMVPWFHAYDRINYARYLPAYIAEMSNLPATHPTIHESFSRGEFVAQRQSDHAFSQIACDMVIEQTINRDSKTKGGMSGITLSKGGVNRWLLSHPERAAITRACQVMAGKDDSIRSRKDLDTARIKRDNATVSELIKTFEAMVDPFAYSGEKLINVSSGLVVSEHVANDIKQAYSKGNSAYQAFCADRILAGGSVSFHKPIKMLKLKTFAAVNKRKESSKTQGAKLLRTSSDLFTRLLIVSKNRSVDLKKVLTYTLTPVPASIATYDGLCNKTTKAALMHAMEKDVPSCRIQASTIPANSALLIDGMALIQSCNPKCETFAEFADVLLAKALHLCTQMRCTRLDFVTDRYPEISIKDCEHTRREASGVQQVDITRPHQKLPRQFAKFLSNGANKEKLVKFLLAMWSRDSTSIPAGIELYLCHGELCTRLNCSEGVMMVTDVQELKCDHQEADTRLLLHAAHAGNTHPGVVINSRDTDVFLLSAAAVHDLPCRVYARTGSGQDTTVLDINQLSSHYGSDVCQAIIGMHVFTGCDTVSAFKGKGKVRPLRLMLESAETVNAFRQLGCEWMPNEELLRGLETFVCTLYDEKTSDVNEARHSLFTLRCRVDEVLPPNKDSLKLHTMRASYQTAIYRRCLKQYILAPSPVGHGWELTNERLTFKWMSIPAAPPEILQHVHCGCKKTHCNATSCSCHKANLPCTELCKCSDCQNTYTLRALEDDDEYSDDECSDDGDSDAEIN